MNGDPEALLPSVRCAGAVFMGPWAPASVGDYVAGPNHVLPTARSARFGSALRVDDFLRRIHVVDLDPVAFGRLAPHVEVLAGSEGLAAHAESVRVRAGAARASVAVSGEAGVTNIPKDAVPNDAVKVTP
jgi:histidinol dehydrogenase